MFKHRVVSQIWGDGGSIPGVLYGDSSGTHPGIVWTPERWPTSPSHYALGTTEEDSE